MREPAFWHRPPSFISLLLTPLGTLYGAVTARRLQREGFDAGIPVLCVGNYHVGGAGKTPTVLALTKLLRELGDTPVMADDCAGRSRSIPNGTWPPMSATSR
jgi:tetraacyldisaccharide 4'-kinase